MNLFYLYLLIFIPFIPVQTNFGFHLNEEGLTWEKVYGQEFKVDSQRILLDPGMFSKKYPEASEWMSQINTAYLTIELAEGETNFIVSKIQLNNEFISKYCCSNGTIQQDFIERDAQFLSQMIQVSIAKLIVNNLTIGK